MLKEGSAELQKACDSGEVSVSAAAKLASLPKSQQTRVIKEGRESGSVKKAVAIAAKHAPPKVDAEWSESELTRRADVESGQCVVANQKTDKRLIAWAIENGCYVRIDRNSPYGNPYVIGDDGDRDDVCDSFEVYFGRKVKLNASVDAGNLAGKVLGCWCYPERCHGNHLVELTEGTK